MCELYAYAATISNEFIRFRIELFDIRLFRAHTSVKAWGAAVPLPVTFTSRHSNPRINVWQKRGVPCSISQKRFGLTRAKTSRNTQSCWRSSWFSSSARFGSLAPMPTTLSPQSPVQFSRTIPPSRTCGRLRSSRTAPSLLRFEPLQYRRLPEAKSHR